MGKKKRINIYVDEDEWEKLQRNIDCSRSEWINQMIIKQREINEQRIEIVETAMSTIRKIYNNPDRSLDYIELDRVKHIAKKNVLDYKILVKQAEKEGIVIKDIAIVKEELRNMDTMRIS